MSGAIGFLSRWSTVFLAVGLQPCRELLLVVQYIGFTPPKSEIRLHAERICTIALYRMIEPNIFVLFLGLSTCPMFPITW